MKRTRLYHFTHFDQAVWMPDEEEPEWLLNMFAEKARDSIRYVGGQIEKCPETQREHFQGLVYFENAKTATAVRRLMLPTSTHVEPSRAGFAAGRRYVTKEDTRARGPWEYGDPPSMGERTDLHDVQERIMAGEAFDDIMLESPSVAARNSQWMSLVESVRLKRLAKDRRKEFIAGTLKKEVIVYWGAPGTGKTRAVYDSVPEDDLYRLSIGSGSKGSLWIDDYHGEPVLLLDEFYGQMPFHLFNELLDIYPLPIQRKGGTTYVNFTKIYITSNRSPDEWYSNSKVPLTQLKAMRRRMTKVRHYGEMPTQTPRGTRGDL